MPFTYQYPHPAVTTDVVLFTIRAGVLQLLLIRRAGEPFADAWALPGGFVEIDEDLEQAAARELAEETGISGVFLEQLYTFGTPSRDPRERIISVAYYALVPEERLSVHAGSDAKEVAWFPYTELPSLAFDHGEIVAMAHERLAAKLSYSTIALQFMPARFTLSRLQSVYEAILGRKLDKRNFRKRITASDSIAATEEKSRDGNHRPARLYAVKTPGRVEIIA
jgi:8-oxo-dGTP diphosphatase